MAAAVDIGGMIDRSPEIRGNRPRIAGTGVTVMRIAVYHNLGFTPSEIAVKYGHLSLAQVHAALAYYFSSKMEIDEDIAAEDSTGAAFEKQFACQPPGSRT
jgi:uncharacterized protein (DUF433 family)